MKPYKHFSFLNLIFVYALLQTSAIGFESGSFGEATGTSVIRYNTSLGREREAAKDMLAAFWAKRELLALVKRKEIKELETTTSLFRDPNERIKEMDRKYDALAQEFKKGLKRMEDLLSANTNSSLVYYKWEDESGSFELGIAVVINDLVLGKNVMNGSSSD